MSRQGRNFCGTWYKGWDAFLQFAQDESISFCHGQEEICPTTHREHVQFWFQTKTKRTVGSARKLAPGVHIDLCKGSIEQNERYVGKDASRKPDGRTFESGTLDKQGSRNDLLRVKRALEEGKEEAEIAADPDTFGAWLRYPAVVERWKRAKIKPRSRSEVPTVDVFIGPTGVGKTKRVFDEHKDSVYIKDHTKWWDGYNGEECILIDEFNPKGNYFVIETLLRLLDRYPFRGEVKGGYVQINSPFIAITTNIPFEDWYPTATQEQIDALNRRVTNKINL